MLAPSAEHFLNAELAHAAAQLTRVRRIQAQMEQQLAAAGLSEVDVYEKLAQSKAYRQLQRDEIVFHQMWLRVHRHLERLPNHAQPAPSVSPGVHLQAADLKPQPYRKPPTPGPNQPCSCGSNIKFKKCCGNPLRQLPRAA